MPHWVSDHSADVWGESDLFSILRSVDDTSIEFVVVPPFPFFPNYEPELDDTDVFPAVNLVYMVRAGQNLRFGFSQTANRPEFRGVLAWWRKIARAIEESELPLIEVSVEVHSSAELLEKITGTAVDSPLCMTCGTKMRPAGSCYVCEGCGSTSGCS